MSTKKVTTSENISDLVMSSWKLWLTDVKLEIEVCNSEEKGDDENWEQIDVDVIARKIL